MTNKTEKHAYIVEPGSQLKSVYNWYAENARLFPLETIAISVNNMVIDVRRTDTGDTLARRVARYKARQTANPAFSGDPTPATHVVCLKPGKTLHDDRYVFHMRAA